MPIIAELGLSPCKGTVALENVDKFVVDSRGLFGDREYMWVEAEPHTNVNHHKGEVAQPGRFLSMREDPRPLTQIVMKPYANGVVLGQRGRAAEDWIIPRKDDTAANRIPVSVHSWHGEAVDQGDEAAEWGSEMIGRPVRLVAVSDEKPRWVEGDPMLGRMGFGDAYPVTVGSAESLALVNRELAAAGKPEITAKRARMNIVLSGLVLPNAVDLSPDIFPEDYIEQIEMIGTDGLALVLKRIKACGRCPVPDTDEVTGERSGAPVRQALGRLARNGRHADAERYGEKPELFWTQNFVMQLPEGMEPGDTIEVLRGSEVRVTYSDTTNWRTNEQLA